MKDGRHGEMATGATDFLHQENREELRLNLFVFPAVKKY